jgi:transcription initiation factor IIE alpha subunit
MTTALFKCTKCGSILVMDKNAWYRNNVVCTKCQGPLTEVEDDFEMSEIVSEEVEDRK